jgi:outer membrane protein assembly factor BamB
MGTIDVGNSVLERGGNQQRTASWTQPTLTKANVMTKLAQDTAFKANFSGGLQGVPLFVASSMAGKGMFIAATTNSNVYALDENTGATIWMHNIGGGGHGIISTPVIDAAAKRIFVASDAGGKHQIHALSLDNGAEIAGWPVDVTTLSSGGYNFNSNDQNQRGALSLVGKYLYVPYGGYFGDGGNYRGWVVAVDTTNPASHAGWATAGQQSGIWAAGGMASDGNGVLAITGNGASNNGAHLDSEEIIRVDGLAVAHHDNANVFYPDIWLSGMDNGDKDFGSCSPAVIMATGGTPAKMVVAPAKPGHLYLLDGANLGGLAGQKRDLVVANTGAESVYTAPTVYKSPSGLRLAITTTIGAKCPGGDKDSQIVGIRLDTGANPINPIIEWCAATNGDDEIRRRSASSTTTDGTANPIVWFMNGANLNAFDGETGALLFNGGTCGGVRRHTSPIVANGRVIVGGDGHLCSWSVH